MQRAFNVATPLCGRLFDSMAFDSGSQLARQTFFKPHVEVELAFVMKDDLRQPGLSIFDVLQATAFVQPALELIDYRTVKPRPIAASR